MLNGKLIIYAAVLAGLAGFGLWVNHLVKTVDSQKDTIKSQSAVIESRDKEIKDTRAQALKDNAASIEHLQKLEEFKNETATLRAAIAAKPDIVRIKAKCPKLPNTEPNTTGTTEATPELTADAREGYIALIEQIKETDLLIKRQAKRIAEDYERCGPK